MDNLQGQLLIAMPSLEDPYFQRSVTYVCEHNEEGAMGLVINQPIKNLNLSELLEKVHDLHRDDLSSDSLKQPVFAGGPVNQERGFVLHTSQPGWASSMVLNDDLMITTSKDILQILGTDLEPSKYLVTLGYAGWDAGQLEQEIADNSWLIIPADQNIIFEIDAEHMWEASGRTLGIDIAQISTQSGHA
ncbi:YqgE/AlgH family protein [Echinimonas agarilytica]|uniref:UPF0301 protein NAF29_17885 n=1 Tax=Echinimonas agarilytica TaxID=1215918 RepID=A0AA42B915_9GAMM|nr:YqgE/AlgH family protein [Echinimonas agarilytica]MCM2681520.1 YqgE/AlgH family protein [Echinimonas agarilytica]